MNQSIVICVHIKALDVLFVGLNEASILFVSYDIVRWIYLVYSGLFVWCIADVSLDTQFDNLSIFPWVHSAIPPPSNNSSITSMAYHVINNSDQSKISSVRRFYNQHRAVHMSEQRHHLYMCHFRRTMDRVCTALLSFISWMASLSNACFKPVILFQFYFSFILHVRPDL